MLSRPSGANKSHCSSVGIFPRISLLRHSGVSCSLFPFPGLIWTVPRSSVGLDSLDADCSEDLDFMEEGDVWCLGVRPEASRAGILQRRGVRFFSSKTRDFGAIAALPTGEERLEGRARTGIRLWEFARLASVELEGDADCAIQSSGRESNHGSLFILAVRFGGWGCRGLRSGRELASHRQMDRGGIPMGHIAVDRCTPGGMKSREEEPAWNMAGSNNK
jgi:hypothetical protein